MEKRPFLAFFLHGLIAILAQVIILRELMAALEGNELFMATTLGFWLLGASLGSLSAHKISAKKVSLRNILAFNLLLVALAIPSEILLIRFFKGKLFLPGEIPNLWLGLSAAFLLLVPFSFILDSFFTLATKLFSPLNKNVPRLVSLAYLSAILGLALGGIIFNFSLVNLNEFQVAFFLSALSLFLSSKLAKSLSLKRISTLFCVVTLLTAFSHFPTRINHQTLKLVFPDLIESLNSQYGRITVTGSASQNNFFETGSLVGTEQDFEASERLVHFFLNFHPKPQKILLIGGGFNGVISEILKYEIVEKVDYVEPDPLFLQTVQKYLPEKLQEALKDSRVKINSLDGRKFLKESREKYDLVVFLLPNPANTLINRFYTQECFREVQSRLNQEGIFVFSLSVPVDYLSEEAEKLVSVLYWTAKRVFPEVLVFPETDSLFLASNQALNSDPQLISDRFEKSNIQTNFITSEYFYYRTKSDHLERFYSIFQENRDLKPNLDFSPTAYLYQISFWQTQFSFLLAKVFRSLVQINSVWLAISLGFPFIFILRWTKKNSLLAPFLVATAGFNLMVLETLTIFSFQAILGVVFAKISLIFTVFFVAMAVGNLWATKNLKSADQKIKISILLLVISGPGYWFLLDKIQTEFPFYLLAFWVGSLVGTIFPLANQIFLGKDNQAALKTGVLYSADLLGAFFGAILTSLFLIPILGIQSTIFLITAVNFLLFFSWPS